MKNTKFTLQLRPSDLIGIDNVLLFLSNSSKPRYIGIIRHADNPLSNTFESERTMDHLHRNYNAFGINSKLLFDEDNFPFHWIRLNSPFGVLVTSRLFYQKFGIPYQSQGFEPQYLLNVNDFGIEKARKFERELSEKQFGLFSEVSNG